MADRADVDPAPVAGPDSPAAPSPDPSACPRCGGKLANPDGLGWCPKCGYCRSLDGDETPAALAPKRVASKPPSALGASEFGEAMKHMPRWVWPLLGGAAAVAVLSVAVDSLLPEECLTRALWSAFQLVLSIIGLIAAQLWAVLMVGARVDGLGAKDLIFPGRSWPAALRRLPATRKPVWLGGWSVTGLICAVLVVGGFNYWLTAVQEARVRRLAARLAGTSSEKSTGRELKAEFAPPPPPAAPAPRAEEQGPVTQCVVIGYQDDGRAVTGLILGMAVGDQLRFAGIVREGLSDELRRDLLKRLSGLRRHEPLIPGITVQGPTVWVKPGVFCDVTRPARGNGNEEPTFQGLRD
jgi:hypothetical protein